MLLRSHFFMLSIMLCFSHAISSQNNSCRLHDIFHHERQRFAGFLDNVLRQKSSKEFYAEADRIFILEKPTTDMEYYAALLKHRNRLIPRFSSYSQIKLVNFQKNLLSDQALKFLDLKKKYHTCIEIGTPGTYTTALQAKNVSIKHSTVINDKQRNSDIFQAFAFRPFNQFIAYDTFLPLNDYEPISNDIKDNSVDLIICFIGLHHIPVEKIETFVASIARILKPNGTFLLREHDCIDDTTKSIAYAAHSVYNIVIPGESEKNEKNEIRNFQPLTYWITLLESCGFKIGNGRLLQEGDSSLNTMIQCTKIARSTEDRIALATEELSTHSDYLRNMEQSYLNAPEWYNVEISQEYGNFINHTPFYAFPYFKSIATFWKIYYCSIAAAAKKRGLFSALTAPHNLMNMFIGSSMTIEYAAKGIISLPIRWMYTGVEPSTLPLLIYDKENRIVGLDPQIEIPQNRNAIKLIKVPRYKPLVETLRKIVFADIDIIEMCGNKEIACKVRYPANTQTPDFNSIKGCSLEYSWQLPTQPADMYAMLTVAFNNLKEIITFCNTKQVEILYFHDY